MKPDFEILNSFIDSISVINEKAEIIFTNKAWKEFAVCNSGDPKKTNAGVNYLELCKTVTGEELENAIEAASGIESVIKREVPLFEMEYPCHSEDERRWFILRVSPVSEDPEHSIISHVNITQRKLAEENVEKGSYQLSAINERLHSTMYKIVHDIQGPLNSIEGLIRLSKNEGEEAKTNPYFTLIEKSILKLRLYVQETLKITAAGPKKESIDFKLILNELFDSIKYFDAFKIVDITMNIKQDIEFCNDKAEINSIISNVVNNGLKYYDNEKAQKTIVINIAVSATEVIISIKDNGIGISKEVLPKIFELNFQQDKESSSGSGIGLHLVRKSLDFINGSIRVKSELGVGTEFIITIPNLKINA